VSSWLAVPAESGGGGGIWGWGGVTYDRPLDRLFVATGNAFAGGTNSGPDFSESTGYCESVVALSPDLHVLGASHPPSVDEPLDLELVGSPVTFNRPGCGELVVAHDKNAQVFGWRTDHLVPDPLSTISLEPFDPSDPVLSQLVLRLLPERPVRRHRCAHRAHRHPSRLLGGGGVEPSLPTDSLNGSPTVAGSAVWYALSGTPKPRAIAGGLVGRGSSLYWLAAGGTQIQEVLPWPPKGRIPSHVVANVDTGTIVSLALGQDGVAALVKDSSTGAASVLVVRGGGPETVVLPAPPGALVAESLRVSGSEVVVDGTVFDGGASQRVLWTSTGDQQWTAVAQ